MSSPQSPSKRLKRLYGARTVHNDMSLKDFAVDLGSNGSKEEKALIEDWFKNKIDVGSSPNQ